MDAVIRSKLIFLVGMVLFVASVFPFLQVLLELKCRIIAAPFSIHHQRLPVTFDGMSINLKEGLLELDGESTTYRYEGDSRENALLRVTAKTGVEKLYYVEFLADEEFSVIEFDEGATKKRHVRKREMRSEPLLGRLVEFVAPSPTYYHSIYFSSWPWLITPWIFPILTLALGAYLMLRRK